MNEKDILKSIKKEADGQLPNLSSFIAQQIPNRPKRWFWQWLPVASLVTSVVVIALLVGESQPIQPSDSTPSSLTSEVTSSSLTSSTPTSTTSVPTSSQVVNPLLRLNDENKAITTTTITSVTLLSGMTTLPTVPAVRLLPLQRELRGDVKGREKIDFDATMSLLKPYLPVAEQFLSTSETPTITSLPSTNPDFANLDTFTVYDIEGEPLEYALYYNVDSSEIIDDETYFSLSGKLIINETTTYAVIGLKTIEEDETKVVFKAVLDEFNYIETTYKLEDEETKITIKKVIDNQLTISSFKIELEDDETTIELRFFEANDLNQTRDNFKFSYETEDGETILEIQYDMQGTTGRIKGKITVYVIPVLNDQSVVIGYQYQAFQYNEDGEREDGEWEDDRERPDKDRDHDEDDDNHNDDDDHEDDEDDAINVGFDL
jgi:hypothetical protein